MINRPTASAASPSPPSPQPCKYIIDTIQEVTSNNSTVLSASPLPSYLNYNDGHVEITTDGSMAMLDASRSSDNISSSGNGRDVTSRSSQVRSGTGVSIPRRRRRTLRPIPMNRDMEREVMSPAQDFDDDIGFARRDEDTEDTVLKIVRANVHVPKSLGLHYFEVTVLEDCSNDSNGSGGDSNAATTEERVQWSTTAWHTERMEETSLSHSKQPVVIGLCTKNSSRYGAISLDKILTERAARRARQGQSTIQQQQQQHFQAALKNVFLYTSSSGNKNISQPYGSPFKKRDTVGCLFNQLDNTISFVKNGTMMGTAFTDVGIRLEQVNLFPFVGLSRKGQKVEINFGSKPFVFSFRSACQECMESVRKRVECTNYCTGFIGPHSPSPPEKKNTVNDSEKHRSHPLLPSLVQYSNGSGASSIDPGIFVRDLVLEYLILQGYSSTAKSLLEDSMISNDQSGFKNALPDLMYKEGGQSHACIQDLPMRQKIMSSIQEGNIGNARSLLKETYPSLLETRVDLDYCLKCQHFCEMMNRHLDDDNGGEEGMTTQDGSSTPRSMRSLIEYGRVELAPMAMKSDMKKDDKWSKSQLDKPTESSKIFLQDLFSLLAFPNPRSSPVAGLLDPQRREGLAEFVNSVILEECHKIGRTPAIETIFRHTSVTADALVMSNDPVAGFFNLASAIQ